ncbi:hypothetical protein [Prauserella rugosa]|uniref:Uncharacterized protein n=1 Tax=Prauserella rugosa TaxID=43354 RepID=A0A660CE77_9PSEU|nr:hypothetical protein [Prauserella rugosa]KMS87531.1 hypothetical protein ACZ91_30825 [Streptomyces regensis]TWH20704.1 hypothetical protein JD82_02551 [Prauserella rugosa]
MSNVEAFANQHADNVLSPLEVTSAVGPVLATPAYAGYTAAAAAVFTAGLISDAVEHHGSDKVTPTGPVPNYGSVGDLLDMRVSSIN